MAEDNTVKYSPQHLQLDKICLQDPDASKDETAEAMQAADPVNIYEKNTWNLPTEIGNEIN